MLSLTKIILLAVVVFAVMSLGKRLKGSRSAPLRPTSKRPAVEVETLERCPVCGVFRAPGTEDVCAHADCPMRRKS
ncbi:MAG: hypothetical protein JXQ84_04765 [Rhodospirillaceae bacterium]|nr:hypothetical protein [Rhodospirillaceae bacterium]